MPFPGGSTFYFWVDILIILGDGSSVALSIIHVSVSVVNNFIHPQTASGYGYYASGELARFIYCLLQKIKQGSSLPLVEQWDEYVLANHSRFPAVADGVFLSWTRDLAALNMIGSFCLKKKLQRDARRFLEEFTTSVLSTVAARSKVGLSCFCPTIIIGGDNHAPLHLLGLFLEGLLERGWKKGSEVEACRAEYQSSVQEQRQLELSSTRSHPDIGDVLSFCSSQARFRARHHLFEVCIVTKGGKTWWLVEPEISELVFVGFPVDSFNGTWSSDSQQKVRHQSESSRDQRRWSAWRSASLAGFREKSALHPAQLVFGLWRHYVDWVCSYLWPHHEQCCFWTVEPRGKLHLVRKLWLGFVLAWIRLWIGEGQWRIRKNSGMRQVALGHCQKIQHPDLVLGSRI